jgi:hypothetical protein
MDLLNETQMHNKNQLIMLITASSLNLLSCKKEEPAGAYFLGAWNLTEYSYSSSGNVNTLTYAAGTRVYEFMEDSSFQIRIAGEPIMYDTWKIRGRDKDSIIFTNLAASGVYKFSRQQ